jgi:Cdc6-like AAA superfamily ATPase
MPINPEIGFTSDVVRDPNRFVGRRDLINDCIKALNTPLGLIAVYGNRGVGKSSLLRQIQQMALGDYALAKSAGLHSQIPERPRRYLTVYYTADQFISNGEALLARLCNDQHSEDGLLRLVPDDGKEIVEFSRTKEVSAGADLKVVSWGGKGIESTKYAKTVQNDIVQTFRNYVSSIVSHQVKTRMKRDALLIIIDEFDVIKDKTGLGSLIKSLSANDVKFAICGIGRDLFDLVQDHGSVERLLEEGALHVKPMADPEIREIFTTAEKLFKYKIRFENNVVDRIIGFSEGYPYFAQLIGKECVNKAPEDSDSVVNLGTLGIVLNDVKSGTAFPTLESKYQKAIGNSDDRRLLLHLLAEQSSDETLFNEVNGKVVLNSARKDAQSLEVKFIDQLIPRLVDPKFGSILRRTGERPGEYEFDNPVFRLYVKLRNID